jgi:hypothetical protein
MTGNRYRDVKKKNHNQYMMCLNFKEVIYFADRTLNYPCFFYQPLS